MRSLPICPDIFYIDCLYSWPIVERPKFDKIYYLSTYLGKIYKSKYI